MQHTVIDLSEEGISFFREETTTQTEKPIAPPAAPMLVSPPKAARQIEFITLPAGWAGGWHPAPDPGCVVVLEGEIEIETGDGDRRRFPTGSLWEHRDFTGRGHNTTVVGAGTARLMLVRLAA